MNQPRYQSLTNWICKTPLRKKIITALCRLFPNVLFLLYALGSIGVFCSFFQSASLEGFSFFLVPAAGLVLVSVLRKKINAPRPAECFEFTPLLSHKAGCSFPSRHTASAFLITCALFWRCLSGAFPLGLVLLALFCAILTAVSRVIAGVHFPRDVLFGAVFAILFSLIGFGASFFCRFL